MCPSSVSIGLLVWFKFCFCSFCDCMCCFDIFHSFIVVSDEQDATKDPISQNECFCLEIYDDMEMIQNDTNL